MDGPLTTARALRREARWRWLVCPGGGFASLGWSGPALCAHAANLLAVLACGAAVVSFTRPPLLAAAALLALALLFWIAELAAVAKGPVHPRPRNRLRAAFAPLAAVQWTLAAGLLGVLLATSGSLRIRGAGMAPALRPGERLLYRRQVDGSKPAPGQLVLFRLGPDSAWGQAGTLVIARVLAGPGDRIALREGRYLVNGQPTSRAAGAVGNQPRALEVPEDPGFLSVPADACFVTQDNPQRSFDSQVLSWARRQRIVSTELRHLWRDGRMLAPAR